jgi:hypothetical protein
MQTVPKSVGNARKEGMRGKIVHILKPKRQRSNAANVENTSTL